MQDIIWKADCHSARPKIYCFLYWTRRFVTVFTKARHWTLSWASRIQLSPSIPISLRSILMLSSHLRLGGLLHSGLPTKTLRKPIPSPMRVTCPAHFILLDLIILTIFSEEYRFMQFSISWRHRESKLKYICIYINFLRHFKTSVVISFYSNFVHNEEAVLLFWIK